MTIILGTCPLNSFRCSNKRCVQSSKVCDGKNDCLDNSDEKEGCNGRDADYELHIIENMNRFIRFVIFNVLVH